jgi:hypothetical protein
MNDTLLRTKTCRYLVVVIKEMAKMLPSKHPLTMLAVKIAKQSKKAINNKQMERY